MRRHWATRSGRTEITESIEAHGISLAEAAERSGLVDADPLDLLVHFAWNTPVVTRTDRVRRLRKEHREWLDAFVPEARAVLDDLLDKYAEHGVGQLDDLRVLEVPPLDRHGSPVEIAAQFGGPSSLHDAVESLGERLYAA